VPFGLILVGSMELRGILGMRCNEDLWQRVVLQYHLRNLNKDEAKDYIKQKTKGYEQEGYSFTTDTYEEIYQLSRGIARVIDRIIELSILVCKSLNQRAIDMLVIQKVGLELKIPTFPNWDIKRETNGDKKKLAVTPEG